MGAKGSTLYEGPQGQAGCRRRSGGLLLSVGACSSRTWVCPHAKPVPRNTSLSAAASHYLTQIHDELQNMQNEHNKQLEMSGTAVCQQDCSRAVRLQDMLHCELESQRRLTEQLKWTPVVLLSLPATMI